MKILPLVVLILIAAGVASNAQDKAVPHLAFERSSGENDGVWIANLDGSAQHKISNGQAPDLSPDGKLLAFNTVQANGQPADRHIAIADLATGKITIFKDIPSTNAMEPIWSADGAKLLFTFYNKANEMRIGIVNADGTGFRDLLANQKYKSYWAPTWAADGASIFAEDMENLYRLGMDGAVQKQWAVATLIPRGGMSGNVRMHASRDGKTLLMDIEMDEKERKGWDGPPASIWTLDLATQKVTRLTPKSLYAWDCHWLDATNILFTSQPAGQDEQSVWKMSVGAQGKDRQRLIRNAQFGSVGG